MPKGIKRKATESELYAKISDLFPNMLSKRDKVLDVRQLARLVGVTPESIYRAFGHNALSMKLFRKLKELRPGMDIRDYEEFLV